MGQPHPTLWPIRPSLGGGGRNPKGGGTNPRVGLGGKETPLAAGPRWVCCPPCPLAYIKGGRHMGAAIPNPSSHLPLLLLLSRVAIGEALSAEKPHHLHHPAVVLLELISSTTPSRLLDQEGGVFIKPYVCTSRRCRSLRRLIGLDHEENTLAAGRYNLAAGGC